MLFSSLKNIFRPRQHFANLGSLIKTEQGAKPRLVTSMSEEELINGCVREDRASQYALYKTYAGKMLAVCRRYARTDLEAEDILQEGFIKVFDNVSKFRHNGSFEGWIRRIMVNTALKLYRKNSFKNEVIGIDDNYDMPQDATVLEKMSQAELMKMVQGLPEGYGIVFNLYAIEGFSHAEIADTLGVNEGTSRSQLAKARKWLQKKVIDSQKIEYERK